MWTLSIWNTIRLFITLGLVIMLVILLIVKSRKNEEYKENPEYDKELKERAEEYKKQRMQDMELDDEAANYSTNGNLYDEYDIDYKEKTDVGSSYYDDK